MRTKLDSIKRAACCDDWSVVGALYIDLCLDPESDKFRLESWAPYVRLRDRERLLQVVDESYAPDGGHGSLSRGNL